ncbi:MAG: polyprenyl synthetase family protein, partial [Myxococcales bacterium]|nr:polyprenyl synthetase family protein [Polyangiaceae bacterium]MDW8249877.1 polyprenyl synthetase family protein [Myxococcales bacterium]
EATSSQADASHGETMDPAMQPSPSPMTFGHLLATTRREIDGRLASLFAEEEAFSSSLGADVVAVVHAVRDLTLRGGKRARPALVVAGYLATPGAPKAALDQVYGIGVALELLQTYLLIHDDWMDNDDIRRGGPTVHVLLQRHYRGNRRMGEVNAILAGDYACSLAQHALFMSLQGSPHGLSVASAFARIQRDVVFGQVLDVGGRAEDVERMHHLKTGSYTVQGPIELGALFAGASRPTLDALARYALPLGIAFQLCDDLLSSFGSEDLTGKPRGNDLRAGKRTAVLVEAERLLDPSRRALLAAVVGQPDATSHQVEAAIRALEESGARAAVEARRDALLQQSLAALDSPALEERALLREAACALALRSA